MSFTTNVEKKPIKCPEEVVKGSLIDKEKRHSMYGVVAGGSGSQKPEEYQRRLIVEGTGVECAKTHMRINWLTNKMAENSRPMTKVDGFDWTENFDGIQKFEGDKTVFINLKCIVGTGGYQTRTLRDECYKFVLYQLKYLEANPKPEYYFANIFDGDESAKKMPMFQYLLQQYEPLKKYVYVGDLAGYFEWINARV
jgi:hypothetical protein